MTLSNASKSSRPLSQRVTECKTFFWFVALASVLVSLPSLSAGLLLDDNLHRQFILEHLHTKSARLPWWDMFDMFGRTDPQEVTRLISFGILPWWTSPTAIWAFLRPLSVASQYIDYLLWPTQPWLMHLHNVFWYACAAALAYAIYRRVLDQMTAAVAGLLYAIDEAHAEGVAWIAGRNTVLTAALVMLTLYNWERARHSSKLRWLLFTAVSLLCAHAASEGAVMVWPYLIGHVIAYPGKGGWAKSARMLAPLAAVTCGWLTLAALGHFMMRGGLVYVDPRTDPIGFLHVAAQRFPDFLSGQFGLPLPLEYVWSAWGGAAIRWASYTVVIALAALLYPLLRDQAAARFLALGTALSGLLACAAMIQPRLLFVPGFGAHGLVALVLVSVLRPTAKRTYANALRQLAAGLLIVVHVPIALWVAAFTPAFMVARNNDFRDIGSHMPAGELPDDPLFVMNAPDALLASFAAGFSDATAGRWSYFLGISAAPVKITRVDPHALLLEPDGGYLTEVTSQTLRHPDEKFFAGQVFAVRDLAISIDALTPDRRPARVRVTWPPGKASRIVWSTWNPATSRFARAILPDVGDSLWVPGSARLDSKSGRLLTAVFRE